MSKFSDQYSNSSIMVLGDSMLDEYIFCEYKSNTILEEKYHIKKLGGAGNVYMNLKNLGVSSVGLSSIIGNDNAGNDLQYLIDDVLDNYIITDSVRTTHKKRYIYQYPFSDKKYNEFRIDIDNKDSVPLASQIVALNIDLPEFLNKTKNKTAIIISDYYKGNITLETLNLLDFSGFITKPFLAIDPHVRNKTAYKNFTKYPFDLIKLNEKEAMELSGNSVSGMISKPILKSIAENITDLFNSPNAIVIITRDRYGLYGYKKDRYSIEVQSPIHYTHNLNHEYNTTGAGDFVMAYLTSILMQKTYKFEHMITLLTLANKFSRKVIMHSSPFTACYSKDIIPYGRY